MIKSYLKRRRLQSKWLAQLYDWTNIHFKEITTNMDSEVQALLACIKNSCRSQNQETIVMRNVVPLFCTVMQIVLVLG